MTRATDHAIATARDLLAKVTYDSDGIMIGHLAGALRCPVAGASARAAMAACCPPTPSPPPTSCAAPSMPLIRKRPRPAMTDRPILFSAPMVNALLAGTKTQTRRVLSLARYPEFSEFGPSDTKGYDWHLRDSGRRWHDLRHPELLKLLRWHIGDRLWVREHWLTWGIFDDLAPSRLTGKEGVSYIADGHKGPRPGKFRQSMHMPRWASRLTLTVTEVRIERVQAISEANAKAEGLKRSPHGNGDQWLNYPDGSSAAGWTSPVDSYRTLWDSINAKRGFGWASNPWVVAVTFAVHRQNIDQLPEASTP